MKNDDLIEAVRLFLDAGRLTTSEFVEAHGTHEPYPHGSLISPDDKWLMANLKGRQALERHQVPS